MVPLTKVLAQHLSSGDGGEGKRNTSLSHTVLLGNVSERWKSTSDYEEVN